MAGCAYPLVTAYGQGPTRTGNGTYEFTLYYNADATQEHIDAKAEQIVERIRADNGHPACAYRTGPMATPSQVKQIRIAVSCDPPSDSGH